jgi:DNA-binding winged helix-turn-helix (wHTH) protein
MTHFLFDRFCLDSDGKLLLRGGEPVHLTPRAFRLLELLIRQRPKAVSKRELLEHVWAGTIVEEANLKSLVLEIRSALADRGGSVDPIRTVYGFGYAFAAPVDEGKPAADPRDVVSLRWNGRPPLTLPEGAHLIGRRADCAVAIEAPSVSRVHARLEVTRDRMTIEDLRSKNGTFVGGMRVEGVAELLPRTRLRIGEVEVEVVRLDVGNASTQTVG